MDLNLQAKFYTELQVKKQYIVLSEEIYILDNGNVERHCFLFFCEELFVVKCKSKHSCESAIYFNLGPNIIEENCIVLITILTISTLG